MSHEALAPLAPTVQLLHDHGRTEQLLRPAKGSGLGFRVGFLSVGLLHVCVCGWGGGEAKGSGLGLGKVQGGELQSSESGGDVSPGAQIGSVLSCMHACVRTCMHV